MAFLRLVMWLLLFVLATFCWVVVFEHGLSDFSRGWNEEWRKFRDSLHSDEAPPAP